VGIINQSLAKTRFPGQDPLGKRFTIGGHNSDGHGGKLVTEETRIVGVCGDNLYANLREQPPPRFFIPYVQQTFFGGMTYEIHTRVKAEAILHRAVLAIDPDLPLVNVRTQDQQIDADLQEERLFVTLTSGFGILALVLASVGIYGVIAYSVAQRTNEIGIRLALGAIPRQVQMMILREASGLSVVGIAAGLGTSLLLPRRQVDALRHRALRSSHVGRSGHSVAGSRIGGKLDSWQPRSEGAADGSAETRE
jgi:hypothetical protein